MYKLSYETLQEIADIPRGGNFVHQLAFGILGKVPMFTCPFIATPCSRAGENSQEPNGRASAA